MGSTSRSVPVERLLASYCRESGLRFLVDGVPEAAIKILSPEAFLPVLVVHAEMAAFEVLKKSKASRDAGLMSAGAFPLGSSLKEDDDALFNIFARVAPLTGDGRASFRSAMFLYSLHKVFGWSARGAVECTGLFDRYGNGGLQRTIQSMHSQTPQQEPLWPPAFSR